MSPPVRLLKTVRLLETLEYIFNKFNKKYLAFGEYENIKSSVFGQKFYKSGYFSGQLNFCPILVKNINNI